MTNAKINKTLRERAIEIEESGSYQKARDEEFNDQFRDFLCDEEYIMNNGIITQDDIQGFLDNFTFMDEWQWAEEQAQSEYEGICDAAYESMKDERMNDD